MVDGAPALKIASASVGILLLFADGTSRAADAGPPPDAGVDTGTIADRFPDASTDVIPDTTPAKPS